jgi:quinol monooxygenase YgiN
MGRLPYVRVVVARGRAIARPAVWVAWIREDARPGIDRVDPSQQRKSLEAGVVSELQGIARFKFHEGKLEEFKHLSAQAMEIVRTKDTGTLQYDIYFNDDQSECIVLERYRDSEALIEHTAHLGDLSAASLATGSVTGDCHPKSSGIESSARSSSRREGLTVPGISGCPR